MSPSDPPLDTVLASIRYAERSPSTSPTEKGYILHYAAPASFPQNNFSIVPHANQKIRNLRTALSNSTSKTLPSLSGAEVSYATHGIHLASLDAAKARQWTPENFDDDEWIESVYLRELQDVLKRELGVREVTVFDWMLRKRAVSFPKRNVGEVNEGEAQPSLSAHIDYTTAELDGRIEQYFGAEKDKVKGRRYQVINIWKPLIHGPCRDFPMAYLDPTTITPATDLFTVDEVFPTVANEVYQIHHNPAHKWYWVPDQLDSEVVIFQAYDSEAGQKKAVPHCSFDLGARGSGVPRSSVEVRAFVFY